MDALALKRPTENDKTKGELDMDVSRDTICCTLGYNILYPRIIYVVPSDTTDWIYKDTHLYYEYVFSLLSFINWITMSIPLLS